MSRGLNKVMIIGNLGNTPEMRYTPGGTPVTSFSLAASRGWTTPRGERREETEWFNVVVWRDLAEICSRFLHKGSRVYIEGRLQTRSWNGHGGRRRFRTEIVANEMIILDKRDSNHNRSYKGHGQGFGEETFEEFGENSLEGEEKKF